MCGTIVYGIITSGTMSITVVRFLLLLHSAYLHMGLPHQIFFMSPTSPVLCIRPSHQRPSYLPYINPLLPCVIFSILVPLHFFIYCLNIIKPSPSRLSHFAFYLPTYVIIADVLSFMILSNLVTSTEKCSVFISPESSFLSFC